MRRQDLEQRRFAGTVVADDPDDLTFLRLERHVAEGPDGFLLAPRGARLEAFEPLHDRIAQRAVGRLKLPDLVLLRQALRTTIAACHSDRVRELRLGAAEICEPGRE